MKPEDEAFVEAIVARFGEHCDRSWDRFGERFEEALVARLTPVALELWERVFNFRGRLEQLNAIERRLEEHIANKDVHVTPGDKTR